jgi:SpoVK/Ycf46/Vps4 family AAA+-type ATPase
VSARGIRPVVTVNADRIPVAARQVIWRETLPELADQAPTLAARYQLEPSAAAAVASDVRTLAKFGRRPIGLEEIADSVRTRSSLEPSAGLKLVRPMAEWDQLVLPADRKSQLRESLERLRHQSRVFDEWKLLEGRPGRWGVRMLFAGPPGTGKTLSAEVLARALGVDLLTVDISRVVSKWIGETEKNLAAAFDAAERTQAVLLFDEADALFGKRTEVSDAHDRYANLETAYLLSRMERFEGLAILSTNLRQNIDPAFVRRLEFVVEFDEPSAAGRAALWQCHLPASAPLAPDVDLKELAALYPIVGGMIRNAAVAASFLAAAADSPIALGHLVRAVRREYEKSGKAFPGEPAGLYRR